MQTLEQIHNEKVESIILGDLNINYQLKGNHQDIKHNFTDMGYEQLITSPTRINKTSESIIDVILTNTPSNVSHSEVIVSSLSDHNMIACTRKMNNIKYNPSLITFRNFSNYDVSVVNNELLNSNWDAVYNATSADLAYKSLTSIPLKVLNKHAPFISKKVKGKPSPWLTAEVKKSMNHRDQLLRKAQKSRAEEDWNNYRRLRTMSQILLIEPNVPILKIN